MSKKHQLTKAQRKRRVEYILRIQGKVEAPAPEVEKYKFRGDQSKRKPHKLKKPKVVYRKRKHRLLVVTADESYYKTF